MEFSQVNEARFDYRIWQRLQWTNMKFAKYFLFAVIFLQPNFQVEADYGLNCSGCGPSYYYGMEWGAWGCFSCDICNSRSSCIKCCYQDDENTTNTTTIAPLDQPQLDTTTNQSNPNFRLAEPAPPKDQSHEAVTDIPPSSTADLVLYVIIGIVIAVVVGVCATIISCDRKRDEDRERQSIQRRSIIRRFRKAFLPCLSPCNLQIPIVDEQQVDILLDPKRNVNSNEPPGNGNSSGPPITANDNDRNQAIYNGSNGDPRVTNEAAMATNRPNDGSGGSHQRASGSNASPVGNPSPDGPTTNLTDEDQGLTQPSILGKDWVVRTESSSDVNESR